MSSATQNKPEKHPKAWLARFAAERARLQLHYCNLFKFWRLCRDKRCRRQQSCCGDTNACLDRRIGEIPRPAQFQARQAIVAATPQHAAAAEREARQLMPYDLVTPDPMAAALAQFKAQMRGAHSSSPVETGEGDRTKCGGGGV